MQLIFIYLELSAAGKVLAATCDLGLVCLANSLVLLNGEESPDNEGGERTSDRCKSDVSSQSLRLAGERVSQPRL